MSPVSIAQIIAEYTAGKNLRQVAEAFGVSHETVRNILKARGVALRPWGSNNANRAKQAVRGGA